LSVHSCYIQVDYTSEFEQISMNAGFKLVMPLKCQVFELWWADMGRLQHKCNRLRLLATYLITNKQNHNEIDYNYIESNHDYNRDYICLETSSERKQILFVWFDV